MTWSGNDEVKRREGQKEVIASPTKKNGITQRLRPIGKDAVAGVGPLKKENRNDPAGSAEDRRTTNQGWR